MHKLMCGLDADTVACVLHVSRCVLACPAHYDDVVMQFDRLLGWPRQHLLPHAGCGSDTCSLRTSSAKYEGCVITLMLMRSVPDAWSWLFVLNRIALNV